MFISYRHHTILFCLFVITYISLLNWLAHVSKLNNGDSVSMNIFSFFVLFSAYDRQRSAERKQSYHFNYGYSLSRDMFDEKKKMLFITGIAKTYDIDSDQFLRVPENVHRSIFTYCLVPERTSRQVQCQTKMLMKRQSKSVMKEDILW